MRIGKLSKALDSKTDLRAEVNRAYIIRKYGTNDDAYQDVWIDGKCCGRARSDITPYRTTSANIWGTLDLGDAYLIVPPLYVFRTEGASGKLIKIEGEVYTLDPGETLPAPLLTRFAAQHNTYYYIDTRQYKHGTNVKFLADQEVKVGEFKSPGNERWTFNHLVGVKFSNVTVGDGDVGIRLKIDGVPLDPLAKGMGRLGIDSTSVPYPPKHDTQWEPITLTDQPVAVEPNHVLEISAINTKGADITPSTDTEMIIDLAIAFLRERVG